MTINAAAYQLSSNDFDWVRGEIRTRAGINLSEDKVELVTGRISRRIRALGLDGFASYRRHLESGEDPQEAAEFVNVLTTNVTAFFREEHHFERLQAMLRKRSKRRLRVWSAGCSSGEEPYSIAMTCQAALQDQIEQWDIKILGTDIDTQMVEQARTGIYPVERTDGLKPTRLKLGFQRGRGPRRGSVRVRPEIARHVSFQQLNLMEPWPFKNKLDVIFCRNVMIYFDRPTCDELFDRYARALSPDGLLFIGHSETVACDHPRLELTGQTVYRLRERGTR